MRNYPLLYLEHLSEDDLALLVRTAGAGEQPERLRARLCDEPQLIDDLLGHPGLFDALYGRPGTDLGGRITPFLAFGALVHRVADELGTERYVLEWTGSRRRLPVFDVASLRGFVEDGMRRFFLVEFLASFTRVASGSTWERTRKGYRRRRYSELDLVRLAEIVDQLPAAQRPAGYRRLGDVALFHAGVFPDFTVRHPPSPVEREHLARSAGVAARQLGPGHDLGFYEAVGAGWYRRAVDAASIGPGPRFLLDVAQQFREARRVLNLLADRYLYRLDTGLTRPAG
jgi:hypothetical protein